MLPQLAYFEITPKIVPTYKTTVIRIHPKGRHCAFSPDKSYQLRIIPMAETMEEYECQPGHTADDPNYVLLTPTFANGDLLCPVDYGMEQQYDLHLYENGKPTQWRFATYALNPDLFARRPYRGDLHVHSFLSDGKEAPEFVAGVYRKYGFDFMAITDHHRYEPSLQAIDAYKDVPIDLKLFPGEEVHLPENHIHIVNFGGDYSVNALCHEDEQRYYREVREIEKTLDCPCGVSSFEYAACLWIYRHIENGGGLSIFAHPHWIGYAYHVREAMTKYQLKNKPFGAFELLSGQTQEENIMQLAMYHQMRAEGADIPIVGSSDSHGTLTNLFPGSFNQNKTFVFAKSTDKADIISAVKDHYSAVVNQPTGEKPMVFGEYRMVSYALFLEQYYFPLHDELCFEEGNQMLSFIAGDENAAKMLEVLHGRTQKLMERIFAAE